MTFKKIQKKFTKFSSNFSLQLIIVLAIALLLSLGGNIILIKEVKKNNLKKSVNSIISAVVKPVSAKEIYSEFICGCCGKTLDPDNICCGDMKQKIDYIDTQVEAGFSKDEIIMKAVKRFGLNSLAKDETKTIIKNKLIASAPAQSPQIVFGKERLDIGTVSQGQGVTTATFNFTNKGKGDLIIDKLTTSCGCTSAAIVYQGQEGPTFTMPGHSKANPKGWSVAIAPGESAQVKVYYDPNAHGPQKKDKEFITRTISIFSNDPVEFEKRLRIEFEQIR